MAILYYTFLALFYALTPALVLWLCRRYSWLSTIGPIMVLYTIGIIFGNALPSTQEMVEAQTLAQNITIPLAIPMMLFGCRFSRNEAGVQLKVVVSGFLSVALAVAGGYLLFGHHITEGADVGGIISGMYTGGTLNANAIQKILNINGMTFTLVNSYDILISFTYFVFLFAIGIRLFRRLYGERRDVTISDADRTALDAEIAKTKMNPYSGLWSKSGTKELLKIVGVTIGVTAVSALATLPFSEEWFMMVFILMLTTLGVACSFFKPIQKMERSYDIGMYLIYIFSLAIATSADFSKFDLEGGLYQIAFMSFAVFVSLAIHAIICRIMRIGADTMVITSVAFINSPPFVPMVAAAMNNRKVLITGLSAGVVGYALGNHFGVLMAKLLSLL